MCIIAGERAHVLQKWEIYTEREREGAVVLDLGELVFQDGVGASIDCDGNAWDSSAWYGNADEHAAGSKGERGILYKGNLWTHKRRKL